MHTKTINTYSLVFTTYPGLPQSRGERAITPKKQKLLSPLCHSNVQVSGHAPLGTRWVELEIEFMAPAVRV